MFSCYGAESCTVGACGEPAWVFIADVTLPPSFFQLPAGAVASGVSPGAGPPGAGGRIGG